MEPEFSLLRSQQLVLYGEEMSAPR